VEGGRGGEEKERRERGREGINLPHGRLKTLAALLHIKSTCKKEQTLTNSIPCICRK